MRQHMLMAEAQEPLREGEAYLWAISREAPLNYIAALLTMRLIWCLKREKKEI